MADVTTTYSTALLRGVAVGVVLLLVAAGCAGPTEREEDEPLTDREFQQRHRTIEPLVDFDDDFVEETAPTLLEFFIDEEGRLRVDILPYVPLDPGAEELDPRMEQLDEEVDPQPLDAPQAPDPDE